MAIKSVLRVGPAMRAPAAIEFAGCDELRNSIVELAQKLALIDV